MKTIGPVAGRQILRQLNGMRETARSIRDLGADVRTLMAGIDAVESEIHAATNKSETLLYKGWIEYREGLPDAGEGKVLTLSGLNVALADELRNRIANHNVTIRYFLTEEECSLEEAGIDFMKTLAGEAHCRYGAHYSELTGYLWTDEEVNVGGHDLIQRLSSHIGKYLILEVVVHKNARQR